MLDRQAAGIAMVDVSWTGGISEARKIANLAEVYQRPVVFHDCTGPVVLTASTHLAMNAPNALVREIVRAFYHGWYGELVTSLPPVRRGAITPPPGPVLGTELRPELPSRPDAHVVISDDRTRTWSGSAPSSSRQLSAAVAFGNGAGRHAVGLLARGDASG